MHPIPSHLLDHDPSSPVSNNSSIKPSGVSISMAQFAFRTALLFVIGWGWLLVGIGVIMDEWMFLSEMSLPLGRNEFKNSEIET